MRIYKIKLKLNDYESEVIEIESEDWEGVVNEVFGKIEIIETEE